ncbi:MAG: hypothetical protein ACU0B1_07275 [Thermohalobaculum sp.]
MATLLIRNADVLVTLDGARREIAGGGLLARDKGVMMHTHLAENDEDVVHTQERFGCRPGRFAAGLMEP